jgi:hypothetical protein
MAASRGATQERLGALRREIEGLKDRIARLKKSKEDEIDWETLGRESSVQFNFNIRRQLRGHFGKVSKRAGFIVVQTLPGWASKWCAVLLSEGGAPEGGCPDARMVHHVSRFCGARACLLPPRCTRWTGATTIRRW